MVFQVWLGWGYMEVFMNDVTNMLPTTAILDSELSSTYLPFLRITLSFMPSDIICYAG